MRVLSLFSGIGAHDLGLERAGMKIVGQVEIDEFCQRTLEKHWPRVPKWRDITAVSASDIRRRCRHIDLITGGFPCQDISCAGKQAGIVEGERSSLFWHMWRLIRDLRPDWLLLENVPALRAKGSDRVLASLEALDYSWWAFVVGAWSVKAPHQRNRVWIVAYRERQGRGEGCRVEGSKSSEGERRAELAFSGKRMANTERELIWQQPGRRKRESGTGAPVAIGDGGGTVGNPKSIDQRLHPAPEGLEGHRQGLLAFPMPPGPDQYPWEEPRTVESAVGAPASRDARRLARWRRAALKAVGNANPPQVAEVMGRAIMDMSTGDERSEALEDKS